MLSLLEIPGNTEIHTTENESMDIVPTPEKVSIENSTSEKTASIKTDAPLPAIMPTIIYSKPTSVPSLREYDISKDSNIDMWHAEDPESYIITNDEWVSRVASQLYIESSGRIRYKNTPVPWYENENGNVLKWIDEPFVNNYITDNELFNYPANADLWQNADYYLSHGFKGDCEDWAIAVTSMMLSGEISIEENGSYVRQVIPAKVVMGTSGGEFDAWIEYSVFGKRYISSTGKLFNQGTGKDESITTFHPEGDWEGFSPIYQFTDKYFKKYENGVLEKIIKELD
jgi:hypothetical protein